MLFPSASKVIKEWYPPGERSRMNALYYSSMDIANILSSVLLIPLVLISSWQVMFITLSVVGFMGTLLIWSLLRDAPDPPSVTENRGPRPSFRSIIDDLRNAMKVEGIGVLIVAQMCTSTVWWAITLWLPAFMAIALGFTGTHSVISVVIPYLGGIAGLFVGSWISDRTGRRVETTSLFCAMTAILLAALIFVHGMVLTVAVLTAAIFFQVLMSPNTVTILQEVCTSRYTCSATGLLNGLSSGIGVIGPLILGIIVASTGSYALAFPFLSALMVIAAFLILRFRTPEHPLRVPGRQ